MKQSPLFIGGAAALVCLKLAMPAETSGALQQNAERARSILKEGIGAKDPNVRVQAVLAASMIGRHERLLAPLAQCLKDKDVTVRIAAVHALGDLKIPGSESALENTLKDDDVPEVAFAAAKALYVLKDPAGEIALTDIFEKKMNPDSNLLKKKSRDFFRNFHSFKSATMFVVSEGIGYVPVPGVGEGFSALSELVSDPDLSARASALLLLGKQTSPETAALLKKALTDDDWSVRASATQLIAHSAVMPLRESLAPLFDDKQEKVRFRAAGAYLHLYLQKP